MNTSKGTGISVHAATLRYARTEWERGQARYAIRLAALARTLTQGK